VQKIAQQRAMGIEQRPQDPDATVIQRCRRHAGQPTPIAWSRATARPAHLDGLDLVVERMPGQHQVGALRCRGLGEQPVTLLARCGRKSGRRLFTRPAQCPMRDAVRMAKRGDSLGLTCRLHTQPVVDRHSEEPHLRRGTVEKILEKEEQGQRVAAARNGGHHGTSCGKVELFENSVAVDRTSVSS